MTETTSMNVIIHTALRRDIARFSGALAGQGAGDPATVERLWPAWTHFSGQLHHHHEAEETIFFPAFGELGVDSALIAELDGEHKAMAAALEAADTSMDALQREPCARTAAAAHDAMAALGLATETHLAHEERDLEPFVARHATTPRMRAAETAVRRGMRGQTGVFVAWLLDDAHPDTAAALRRHIPPPVVFTLTRTSGRRYARRIAPAWA